MLKLNRLDLKPNRLLIVPVGIEIPETAPTSHQQPPFNRTSWN